MRTGISITVSDADRGRLEAITADRNAAQKHVWRARIVLLSADGAGTNAIMAVTGTAKTTVWRWQERYMAEGIDGLLRDKTRPPGKAPVPDERAAKVVEMTLKPPPHEATHWSARAMAKGHRPRRLDGAGDLEVARSGIPSKLVTQSSMTAPGKHAHD